MMKALRDLANRAKNLPNIEHDVWKFAVNSNKELILDLNRDQMWEYGIVDIKKPNDKLQYAPFTIAAKQGYILGIPKAKFARIDHITLKWSGAFHESLQLNVGRGFFLIWSANQTWQLKLKNQERFGNALGLTEKSIQKMIDLFLPIFQKSIKNYLLTGKIG